jgi:hypothetical protein
MLCVFTRIRAGGSTSSAARVVMMMMLLLLLGWRNQRWWRCWWWKDRRRRHVSGRRIPCRVQACFVPSRHRWQLMHSNRDEARQVRGDGQIHHSHARSAPSLSLPPFRVLRIGNKESTCSYQGRLTHKIIFRSRAPDMKPEPSGSHTMAVTVSV